MATTAPKIDWLIIAPDREGALPKRMAVRPDHLKGLGPKVEAGLYSFGGAMLTEPEVEGQPPKINGSVMLAHAATKEEVLEILKGDVYAPEVWDFEKLQIIPFKTFLMKPKA